MVVPFVNAPRQPGLPSKEYYKDPELVIKYGKVIGQVLEALLAEAGPYSTLLRSMRNRFSALNTELVESLVDFESKLAKATPATEEAEDVTKYYNPLSLDETNDLIPELSIPYLISSLGPPDYTPSKLIVGSPSYLKTVSRLLHETSTETLQAYLVWKTVQSYAYEVEDEALKPLKRFNNELQGKDPDASEERWRTCIKFADNGLGTIQIRSLNCIETDDIIGWILSKFFIEKAFSAVAKDFGDRIVSDIKAQFIKKLHGAGWMSKDVRKLGIEKGKYHQSGPSMIYAGARWQLTKYHLVHNIVQKIGYPTKSPDIRDSSALQEYYESVNISGTSFFTNAFAIAKFDTKREWSALGKPTNRDEWVSSILEWSF